eukprot:5992112-Prymnesium_polylepis.2
MDLLPTLGRRELRAPVCAAATLHGPVTLGAPPFTLGAPLFTLGPSARERHSSPWDHQPGSATLQPGSATLHRIRRFAADVGQPLRAPPLEPAPLHPGT